jgi:hypothetical protein
MIMGVLGQGKLIKIDHVCYSAASLHSRRFSEATVSTNNDSRSGNPGSTITIESPSRKRNVRPYAQVELPYRGLLLKFDNPLSLWLWVGRKFQSSAWDCSTQHPSGWWWRRDGQQHPRGH